MGILYLENNQTTGAFTQERLELLKLISSQAAISLENASLYANLADALYYCFEYVSNGKATLGCAALTLKGPATSNQARLRGLYTCVWDAPSYQLLVTALAILLF